MEQINLNIIPDGVMPVCHASQFDKNRTIRFNLKQNGSVFTLDGTETITCEVRKPDDSENTINVANTSSSYVDVTFGFGDTDLSGYAMCELKIVKGTQTIGSRNFLLNIEADAFDGSKLEERSASGAIASFETNYIDNLNELIVNITATQAGSGTPSPSNPRAISGWSSCDVVRCGKNFIKYPYAETSKTINNITFTDNGNGTVTINSTGASATTYFNMAVQADPILFKQGTYTVNQVYTSSDVQFNIYKADGTTISTGYSERTFTLSEDAYVYYFLRINTGAIINNITVYPQVEIGSTATTYEPYNGNTDTIFLGDTCYGGVLNVTTGELTITHYYQDLGDLSWSYITSGTVNRFQANLTENCSPLEDNTKIANAISSIFAVNSWANVTNVNTYDYTIAINAGGNVITIHDSDYTDAPTFTTAMSGHELVYELATPTTVQLTPTEVRTLLEENNVFADPGDIVSCKFLVEVT